MAEIKGTGGDIYVQRLLWEEEDGNIKHLNICVAFSTRPKCAVNLGRMVTPSKAWKGSGQFF